VAGTKRPKAFCGLGSATEPLLDSADCFSDKWDGHGRKLAQDCVSGVESGAYWDVVFDGVVHLGTSVTVLSLPVARCGTRGRVSNQPVDIGNVVSCRVSHGAMVAPKLRIAPIISD
jgi:hypothetical protein